MNWEKLVAVLRQEADSHRQEAVFDEATGLWLSDIDMTAYYVLTGIATAIEEATK